MADLSPDALAIIAAMQAKQPEGLSSKQQSELWVKMGLGAVGIVLVGGFTMVMTAIASAGEHAEANSEKIDRMAESVTKLVAVSDQQQEELGERGVWMSDMNAHAEKSRMADQEHDQRLRALEEGRE